MQNQNNLCKKNYRQRRLEQKSVVGNTFHFIRHPSSHQTVSKLTSHLTSCFYINLFKCWWTLPSGKEWICVVPMALSVVEHMFQAKQECGVVRCPTTSVLACGSPKLLVVYCWVAANLEIWQTVSANEGWDLYWKTLLSLEYCVLAPKWRLMLPLLQCACCNQKLIPEASNLASLWG